MATTAWLVLGLAVWMSVGVLVALLLGRMIRLRDNPPPSGHGYSRPLIPIPPDDPAVVSSNDELNETPDEPSVLHPGHHVESPSTGGTTSSPPEGTS